MKGFSVLNPLFHKDGRPLLNTDFAHYYQRIRSKQKREALLWSLGLVVLYLGAGNLAEFNLHTVWVSIPHFFDYLAETIPTLHWPLLFADGRTEGSLAYWGYRLNIQLPLIWETLQLALAATIFSVLVATVLAFLAAGNTFTPASVRLAIRTLVAFFAHHAGAGVGGDVRDGVRHRRHSRLPGAGAAHHRQPDQAVLRVDRNRLQ